MKKERGEGKEGEQRGGEERRKEEEKCVHTQKNAHRHTNRHTHAAQVDKRALMYILTKFLRRCKDDGRSLRRTQGAK